MQINVAVTDANNIICEVVPPQTQVITIDRGVAGNGIVSIVPVTISTFQYLRITYTNGTVQDVGPLTSTAYTATAPITIVGNTISLATVPIASGGTNATTAAGAIQNLLPSYTGNANKRLGLNSAGTALEWVLDGGGTVTSVAASGGTTGLSFSGGPITTSGTLTLAGTLAIANGGSGQTTAQLAMNAFAGAVTSGSYLRGNGTNVVMSTIQAADVPTLNQNTTGTAANVTGVVAIANGGTGQTTANAAFNALAPSQTGNSGKYLTTDGSNTSWATNPLGTVTSVAATVPSFLSISGSPITTSGTLAFGLSGTALPTTSGGTGLTSFTANGVVYASSSSALATGSALTFNGTTLQNSVANYASIVAQSAGDTDTNFQAISSTCTTILASNSTGGYIGTFTASKPLVFYTGSSEQMRLNSTGLGIGTSSPAQKLHVENNANSSTWMKVANTNTGSGAAAGVLFTNNGGDLGALSLTSSANSPSNSLFLRSLSTNTLTLGTNNTVQATLDSSGNLGLGVTPTNNTLGKTLQVGQAGAWVAESGTNRWWLASNWYYNSGDKYINNGYATLYSQQNGTHQWQIAPSGTAGNAITFTQAMTLDASSNLLLGTTSQAGSAKLTLKQSTDNSAGGLGLVATDGNGAIISRTTDGSLTFRNGGAIRFDLDSVGRAGLGTQGTTGDRFFDMSFQGATLDAGANGFALVANPTFPNTITSTIFNIYTGPNLTAGTTVANVYNLYLEANNTAGSTVTGNKWGLYQAGSSDKNYFAGDLGIGTTPSYKLDVGGDTRVQGNLFLTDNVKALVFGTGTTSYIIGSSAGNNIRFVTNSTERARIDSGGNFIIGDSTSAGRLTVMTAETKGQNATPFTITSNDSSNQFQLIFTRSTNSYYKIQSVEQGVAYRGIAMQVDGGNLFVGTTSQLLAGKFCVVDTAGQNGGTFQTLASANTYTAIAGSRNGNNGNVAEWWYNTSTLVGTISVTSVATLYNTTSDQRLKENIQDATSASDLIDSLKVRKFDWKADGSHQRYGFIAQELATVAPEAVYQPADTEQMMAVDYSKLVPMLVKEIQSLRKRLADAGI